jgi:hypothetical protein
VNSINIIVYNGWVWGGTGTNNLIITTQHPDQTNTGNATSPFYDSATNYAMGRLLSLLPTYTGAGWNSTFVINNIPPCITNLYMNKASFLSNPQGILPENVTRNANDNNNYNADIAGDMVVDTNACFSGFYNNFCDLPQLQNFMQHPEVIDNVGVIYNCSSVEGQNFMSIHDFSGTTNSFTMGQGERMRQYIISNPTDFNPLLNLLDNGYSDISVLYEPFSISDGSGGNGNTTIAYSKTYSTNATNTGANVWNCGPFTMRFQTGFDCEFYPYNATTINQTPYQHLDYPTTTSISVKIPILGQQIYQNVAPICFYSFEPFTSGDIKSLSNLGSGVYTQEQLDEIKASDPKLYEELQSGKYHIITKQTDSGFIDQKIIYKN